VRIELSRRRCSYVILYPTSRRRESEQMCSESWRRMPASIRGLERGGPVVASLGDECGYRPRSAGSLGDGFAEGGRST